MADECAVCFLILHSSYVRLTYFYYVSLDTLETVVSFVRHQFYEIYTITSAERRNKKYEYHERYDTCTILKLSNVARKIVFCAIAKRILLSRNNEFYETNLNFKDIHIHDQLAMRRRCCDDRHNANSSDKNQVGMIIDEHQKSSSFQSTAFELQEITRVLMST